MKPGFDRLDLVVCLVRCRCLLAWCQKIGTNPSFHLCCDCVLSWSPSVTPEWTCVIGCQLVSDLPVFCVGNPWTKIGLVVCRPSLCRLRLLLVMWNPGRLTVKRFCHNYEKFWQHYEKDFFQVFILVIDKTPR